LLLWFRNDLRTHDNPALHYFLQHRDLQQVGKAIFFMCEKQWREHDWSAIKIDFIKRHAHALVEELASINIELLLVDVDNFAEQNNYIQTLIKQHRITEVVANSEVEFNEKNRDLALVNQGVQLTLFEADVIVPKGNILNQSGEMYKVFTPFKRAWLTYVQEFGFDYLGKHCQNLSSVNEVTAEHQSGKWPLARDFEAQMLPRFLNEKIHAYNVQRDIPSIKGTSGLSPYLAAGVTSPRYVLRLLLNQYPDLIQASDSENFAWLNELIWREFYRNLIFHHQRLCKYKNYKESYDALTWHFDQNLFTAWCEGKTGYPIVDAAMRQLNQTGWMHNRLRMIVASFLTKHLLIDWRLGEKFFMQHLIDGDLASNNGGWQWAASTGCDAQPYFRIFNPIRQSERFDPNGDFIRKYIPELKQVKGKDIHFPHQYIRKNKLNIYWPAIVEHKEARIKALAFYKI
jgi:deoxyribodipyrimidine photo-lyase